MIFLLAIIFRKINLGRILVFKFRFYIATGIFSLIFSLCPIRAESIPAPSSAENSSQLCRDFVKNLANRAIEIINTPQITDDKVLEEFSKIVRANFAVGSMAKFSLGRYGRVLNKAQKKDFLDCFVNMLIKLYVSNFKDYKMAMFSVINVKEKTKSQYLVETKVSIPGRKEIAIMWSIYNKNGEMKIYDAILDEVSMGQIQRAEICGGISEKGLNKFMLEFKNKYGK
jgi:ABC-type transporter MlaC component